MTIQELVEGRIVGYFFWFFGLELTIQKYRTSKGKRLRMTLFAWYSSLAQYVPSAAAAFSQLDLFWQFLSFVIGFAFSSLMITMSTFVLCTVALSLVSLLRETFMYLVNSHLFYRLSYLLGPCSIVIQWHGYPSLYKNRVRSNIRCLFDILTSCGRRGKQDFSCFW